MHNKQKYFLIICCSKCFQNCRDMNSNCRKYALPSLCLSSLPICRTPERTNLLYFSNLAMLANFFGNNTRKKRFVSREHKSGYIFLKKKSIFFDDVFSKDISSKYPPTKETENLKRVCREECELLENELCQKEYAIAKRHPVISTVGVEECQQVPQQKDCSTLGITIEVNENENCFWEDGSSYRGITNISQSGKPCLRWSSLMKEISDYPELIGHNYCRYVHRYGCISSIFSTPYSKIPIVINHLTRSKSYSKTHLKVEYLPTYRCTYVY